MPCFPFYKLVPGGNPTILLTGSLDQTVSLAQLNTTLLSQFHIHGEQAGVLSMATATQLPHLEMMGGEFCLNATRSAALVLARLGMLTLTSVHTWQGKLTVSGADAPLEVTVQQSAHRHQEASQPKKYSLPAQQLALPFTAVAASLTDASKQKVAPASSHLHSQTLPYSTVPAAQHIQSKETTALTSPQAHVTVDMPLPTEPNAITQLTEGATLVTLAGISHILLSSKLHPQTVDIAQQTHDWRTRAELQDAPASGVVWYHETPDGYAITPYVLVHATQTEYAETACGSASLALAFAHWRSSLAPTALQQRQSIAITQPSQEQLIATQCTYAKNKQEQISISGLVRLVAEGTAFL